MKSTVTLSKVRFQELIARGLNRPMIAKELDITVKLVNEAFIRWDLKVKKTANAVIWDDGDVLPENVVEDLTIPRPLNPAILETLVKDEAEDNLELVEISTEEEEATF